MKRDIKITIYCAQSFDRFSNDVLVTNPINFDLRPDGNAMSVNEVAKKTVELVKANKDFTAITVHDTVLNVIGLMIAEDLIDRRGVEIKFYDEDTNELKTATYDNQGYLLDWHIGYLSCWEPYLTKELA